MKTKVKKKKSVLDWLVPVIIVIVALAVLVGIFLEPIKTSVTNTNARGRILMESSDGSVKLNQTTAEAIAWIQLYNTYYETYSNYSIYKNIVDQLGSSIDLSSLISNSEVSFVESNISAMSANLGLRFYTASDRNADESVTEEMIAASTETFAVYMAAGLSSSEGEIFSGMLDDFKMYVAVYAEATAAGVQPDADETASATSFVDGLKGVADIVAGNVSFNKFLSSFVGSSVKQEDIETAYRILSVCSKYITAQGDVFYDAVTDAERVAYRDENKNLFYSADYISYITEDKAFAETLNKLDDKDAFRDAVTDYVLRDSYATALAEVEQTILNDTAFIDDIASVLGGSGFGAEKTYQKSETAGLDKALAEFLFADKTRTDDHVELCTAGADAYLVWFKEASADSVTVRTKKFAADGNTAYDGISDFRASAFEDAKKAYDEDSTEKKYDSNAYGDVVDALTEALQNDPAKETNMTYTKDAAEGSLQAWLNDFSRVAGDKKVFEIATGDTTEYTAALLLEPMKLDEEETVAGAYAAFSDRETAEAELAGLAGLTGTKLLSTVVNIDSSNADASTAFKRGDLLSSTVVADWLFDSARRANEYAIVEESEDTVYIVAFRNGGLNAWESTATDSLSSEKLTDWEDAGRESVKLNQSSLKALGVEETED